MSKTFTSRPAVAHSRGRGTASRQTQTIPGQQNKTSTSNTGSRATAGLKNQSLVTSPSKRTGMSTAGQPGMEGRETSPQRNQQEIGQRMSYEGCYTKISPNERKRQEISNQARKEEENYQAFKEKNRLAHVSYIGTAGGGQISKTDSRQKLEQNHRTSQYDTRLKQQKWREDKKKQEELTHQQRKDTQRQKAVKNEQMSLQQQRDQKQKWDEDRKKKNEEFLRRFEKKTTAVTKQETTGNHNNTLGATGFTDPNTNITNVPVGHQQSDVISPGRNSSTFDRNIETLQDMFPHYDVEMLQDILHQTDNSLEDAMQLLHA